jgi:hypothetical protein
MILLRSHKMIKISLYHKVSVWIIYLFFYIQYMYKYTLCVSVFTLIKKNDSLL